MVGSPPFDLPALKPLLDNTLLADSKRPFALVSSLIGHAYIRQNFPFIWFFQIMIPAGQCPYISSIRWSQKKKMFPLFRKYHFYNWNYTVTYYYHISKSVICWDQNSIETKAEPKKLIYTTSCVILLKSYSWLCFSLYKPFVFCYCKIV